MSASSSTSPIKRVSTVEAIVEHMLERIRSGEFLPGDRLPSERDLQREIGVGRLSLREALARLNALGVIRVDHGRGSYVQGTIDSSVLGTAMVPLFPTRNTKSLQDLVEARSLIEGELAARAAERRNDEDIKTLVSKLENPGQALSDNEALAELDFEFHREIARIADNNFLSVMLEALSEHVRAFLQDYAAAHHDRKDAIERHRPLLDAIVEGNSDLAREVARRHIDTCKSSLQSYVDKEIGKQDDQNS
jgi:GntR family transcriptional regulator, transcriptional repressor for pyruvate dehydrogenase complex